MPDPVCFENISISFHNCQSADLLFGGIPIRLWYPDNGSFLFSTKALEQRLTTHVAWTSRICITNGQAWDWNTNFIRSCWSVFNDLFSWKIVRFVVCKHSNLLTYSLHDIYLFFHWICEIHLCFLFFLGKIA